MTIITHFTTVNALASIKKERIIWREGVMFHRKAFFKTKQPLQVQEIAEHCYARYELIPRFVWFTAQNDYRSNNRPSWMQAPLHFDAEEIGAIKWSSYKRKIAYHKHKYAVANAMDDAAIRAGDDPDQWWIVDHPVKISLLKNPEIFESEETKENLALLQKYLRVAA